MAILGLSNCCSVFFFLSRVWQGYDLLFYSHSVKTMTASLSLSEKPPHNLKASNMASSALPCLCSFLACHLECDRNLIGLH